MQCVVKFISLTPSPSLITVPLPRSGPSGIWVIDSPPSPGRALDMGNTINWGIFKRHFWGELLRHQHAQTAA